MSENNWPPKFTIDQESVLKLFTGESFYSSVYASIREAVLNAIDAIGRRRDVQPKCLRKRVNAACPSTTSTWSFARIFARFRVNLSTPSSG